MFKNILLLCLIFSYGYACEEYTLKNGIKTCLKETHVEKGELNIQFLAIGGYSELKSEERASAELAAKLALHSPKLQSEMYEHSVDLDCHIYPFYRTVEGSAETKEAKDLLNLMVKLVNTRDFDESFFVPCLEKSITKLKKVSSEPAHKYDLIYNNVNFTHGEALNLLSEADLKKAKFSDSKRLFQHFFSNPGNYTIVVVGDFKLEEMKKLLEETVGSLPTGKNEIVQPQFPQMFSGIKPHIVKSIDKGPSLNRLSLPLQIEATPEKIQEAELLAELISEKLRRILFLDVEVYLDLPFYPYTQGAIYIIEYRTPSNEAEKTFPLILGELQKILQQEWTDEEITAILDYKKQNQNLSVKSNDYWLSTLSNDMLLGCNELKNNIDFLHFKERIKKYFSLDHYSIVSLPQ